MKQAQPARKSIVLFGATGTIGQATARALRDDGHAVCCVTRRETAVVPQRCAQRLIGPDGVAGLDLAGFDTVVSCMASRTGNPADAWAVDHDAHLAILRAAQRSGVGQFVLLSAICVQKPKLAFQRAKLAFEAALTDSGMTYCIVRPTAFFKSLSGQIARVKAGKPYLMFGDGERTRCTPISDRDIARYLANCVTDPALWNRVLPVGGPGPALSPRQMGEMMFDLTGQTPKYRSVPLWLMTGIVGALTLGGTISPRLGDKAEFARIGRYYATESMLVWDGNKYDAAATPAFGTDTLRDHYRAVIAGDVAADLGDHAMF